MKVLTLNTHSWMEKSPVAQIEVLSQFIVEKNLDLIALQEVNQLIGGAPAVLDEYFQTSGEEEPVLVDNFIYCLVLRLKELGKNYYWSWSYNHIGYDKFHEGVGLLSKNPITAETLAISKKTDPADYKTRKLLLGRTTIDSREILACSGHFSWWGEDGFAYEWRQAEKYLEKNSLPLILAGDFNNAAEISNEGYQLVKESPLKLQDSFSSAKIKQGSATVVKKIDGWEKNTQPLRIDYVFTSNDFKIQVYQICFDGNNAQQISDHYGIYVELS